MKANTTYDVIVVGVGAMGAATCWQLARRGIRTLGLEQFDVPHSRGSSHGYSRMTRMAYHENPAYVQLLRRAYQLWGELEQESGEVILHAVGGLYMGAENGPLVRGSLQSAREHKLPYELLDRQALHDRYPQFEVPDDWVGLLEAKGGFLIPELAICAMTQLAMMKGCRIQAHESVVAWDADADGVTVRTRRGTYHADQIVFTSGAWAHKILPPINGRLLITRQVLGWVWPSEPARFRLGTLPVWMIDRGDTSLYYGFPMITLSPGLKIALHEPLSLTDPDAVNRVINDEDEETFRECLRRNIPTANGPLLALRTCLYENTPDGNFIIDQLPERRRVTFACGFSGHGFKFATVVGEILADLSTRSRSDLPIGFLRLDRFTARSTKQDVRVLEKTNGSPPLTGKYQS